MDATADMVTTILEVRQWSARSVGSQVPAFVVRIDCHLASVTGLFTHIYLQSNLVMEFGSIMAWLYVLRYWKLKTAVEGSFFITTRRVIPDNARYTCD